MNRCKDCDKEFFVNEREKEFYIQKGWSLPVRCYDCRKAKKARNMIMAEPRSHKPEAERYWE